MVNQPPHLKPKILYVDDEEQALKYFSRAYADEFSVLTATSADEAERIAAENSDTLSIVITDQRMPGRTGASLLESLRQNHPSIIRLLTTAYSDLGGAIDAVNRGEILRYIVKPWDIDHLRQDLQTAIKVFELQKQRDELLAEKISVLHRVRASDRLRALLTAAATVDPTGTCQRAVCCYAIETAKLAMPPTPASLASLEFWTEIIGETRTLQATARGLARLTTEPRSVFSASGTTVHTMLDLLNEVSGNEKLAAPLPDRDTRLPIDKAFAETLIRAVALSAFQRLASDTLKVRCVEDCQSWQLVFSGVEIPDQILPLHLREMTQEGHHHDPLLDAIILSQAAGGNVAVSTTPGSSQLELHLTLPTDVPTAQVDPSREEALLRSAYESLEKWEPAGEPRP